MKKPAIKITLVDRKGECHCHRGHKIGDSFDFDNDRGKLCPMAMHAGFPFIDILRYGGQPPLNKDGEVRFCCPDPEVVNVFRLDTVERQLKGR